MQNEKTILVITAYVNKQLQTNKVGVGQVDGVTEWRLGDKGFAVGPHLEAWSPKELALRVIAAFTPPKPIRIKKHEDD